MGTRHNRWEEVGGKKEGKEMFSLPSTVPSNWKKHFTDLFNLPC